MYSVRIKNDGVSYYLHDDKVKLSSGKVVKGINTIDSFSFTMSPLHPCFHMLHDLKTQIEVINETRNRVELAGRVLYTNDDMDESGKIKKEVVCESCLGYLCDSEQEPVTEREWTVEQFMRHVVDVHNSQVEEYKKIQEFFVLGEAYGVTLKCPIQRENTWETIKKNLLDSLGLEIDYSGVTKDGFVLDVRKDEKNLDNSSAKIELSRNMKSISRERDPSEIVTRLVPLGAKLKDSEGNETDKQLDITSVNNGLKYIEDTEALELYGIRYKSVEFNDVTSAEILLEKGDEWLKANNRVRVKYTVTALDLSLLGLDYADFEVRNYYRLDNPLLGINDAARIIKKNIDICEEVKSSFDIGDNFETVSDIQIRKAKEVAKTLTSDYASLEQLISDTDEANMAATEELIAETEELITEEEERAKGVEASLKVNQDNIEARVENAEGDISTLTQTVNGFETRVENAEGDISSLMQTVNSIELSVANSVTSAELALTIGDDGIARISANADEIQLTGNKVSISSNYFTLTKTGGLTCQYATLKEAYLTSVSGNEKVTIDAGSIALNHTSYGVNSYIGYNYYQIIQGLHRLDMGTSSTRSYIRGESKHEISFTNDNATLSGTWLGTSSSAITSDVNKKHDIEGLTAAYSALFYGLTPRLYKYNDGTSNRVHVGFIAQEVEAAINAAGLTTQDFAGFVRAECINEETEELEEVCCLRYEEFIALCVHEIQALKKEIGEVKNNG